MLRPRHAMCESALRILTKPILGPGRKSGHPPPYNAYIKNTWSNVFTSPETLMALTQATVYIYYQDPGSSATRISFLRGKDKVAQYRFTYSLSQRIFDMWATSV